MRQFLKKYSISTERRCHVIDDQSNIAMVEAGLGISIMPRMLLRSCTAAVKIYPIEPEEYRVVGLAVQRPTAMAPAVEQMFHHIVDFCRQMDRSFSENTKMTGPQRCGPVFTSPIGRVDD